MRIKRIKQKWLEIKHRYAISLSSYLNGKEWEYFLKLSEMEDEE